MKFLDRRETNESESICTKRFSLIKNESLRSCKQSDTFWLYRRGYSIWWIYGSPIPKRCLGLLKDSRRHYFYKGCCISIKSYQLIILIVNNVSLRCDFRINDFKLPSVSSKYIVNIGNLKPVWIFNCGISFSFHGLVVVRSNISATTCGARLFEAIQGIRHALKVASDHKWNRSTVATWIYDRKVTIQKFCYFSNS